MASVVAQPPDFAALTDSLPTYFRSLPGVGPGLPADARRARLDLAKVEAFATEGKVDETVLLGWRLAPDMFALARQVQIATDHAKGCCARLAGRDVPKWPDAETNIAELRARIAKTLDYVQSFPPDAIDGSEDRAIAGSRELRFTGQQYLVGFALPSFYFHATTAYTILRHCGLPIGKRDFLGMS